MYNFPSVLVEFQLPEIQNTLLETGDLLRITGDRAITVE